MKYYDLLGEPGPGFEKSTAKLAFAVPRDHEDAKQIVRTKGKILLNPPHGTIDTAVLQVAKDNDITIALSLRQFLEASRYKRAKMATWYRKLMKLALKKRCRILLVTDAKDWQQVRTPLQLASLGSYLGMTPQQAKWSISQVPEYLLGVE